MTPSERPPTGAVVSLAPVALAQWEYIHDIQSVGQDSTWFCAECLPVVKHDFNK